MLKSLMPIIIKIAKQAIDAFAKGEDVGTDGIKGIQTGYMVAKIWLRDIVAETENTYDDEVLTAFIALCEDTAAEGSFPLPKLD